MFFCSATLGAARSCCPWRAASAVVLGSSRRVGTAARAARSRPAGVRWSPTSRRLHARVTVVGGRRRTPPLEVSRRRVVASRRQSAAVVADSAPAPPISAGAADSAAQRGRALVTQAAAWPGRISRRLSRATSSSAPSGRKAANARSASRVAQHGDQASRWKPRGTFVERPLVGGGSPTRRRGTPRRASRRSSACPRSERLARALIGICRSAASQVCVAGGPASSGSCRR
jgi:hypothetical protein